MICKANAEIREALATAEVARRQGGRLRRQLAFIDWVLARLEEMNLAGERQVSESVMPLLRAICQDLPTSIASPQWGLTVREVMDQCFELQQQLLVPPVRRRVLH